MLAWHQRAKVGGIDRAIAVAIGFSEDLLELRLTQAELTQNPSHLIRRDQTVAVLVEDAECHLEAALLIALQGCDERDELVERDAAGGIGIE